MSEFYDAITFRPKKDGGFRAVRIGFATLSDKGGMDLYLDALPLQNDRGNVVVAIRPQRERQQETQEQRRDPNYTGGQAPSGNGDVYSDSVPF